MEKCWGLGSGEVGGELAPQRFGVTGGREAGLGTEWGSGQSPVPGERLRARAGGESNVGWALLLPGLAGTCSTAFSGSKLHILFIFCAKRSCSEAIMGMFLSNVVFPLQASGTVTFLYILVTMSRTACCLHTGELCLGSPNFAHPGGSGAFSPSPGLTLYRCSRARGAGLLQGSRAGWGAPGGPQEVTPRGPGPGRTRPLHPALLVGVGCCGHKLQDRAMELGGCRREEQHSWVSVELISCSSWVWKCFSRSGCGGA